MFIYSYKQGSASARALAEVTGARRIRHENSRFRGNQDKVVINWGSSKLPEQVSRCKILNRPEVVENASNKLKFFKTVGGACRIPPFTTSKAEAMAFCSNGKIIVERHKLTGNSGEGIRLVEANKPEEIQDAPLYVVYVPKKQEYRVHVANNTVVDLQRKARRRDVPDDQIDWRIRNHDNGFIFQRNDLEVPVDVRVQALKSCKALGLDFGAVDVIYNESKGRAYVLEVNTAPGLTGETLEGYARRFSQWNFNNVGGAVANGDVPEHGEHFDARLGREWVARARFNDVMDNGPRVFIEGGFGGE